MKEISKDVLCEYILFYMSVMTGFSINNLSDEEYEAKIGNLSMIPYYDLLDIYETLRPICKDNFNIY